jgi:uncharacterized protein
MEPIPKFTDAHAARLRAFLQAPQRPAGTMSYCELAGFLFAVACAPEPVPPSEWLPLVFGEDEANYQDLHEVETIMQAILGLYNRINREVVEGRVALPPGCEMREAAMANLEPDAPLGAWARGFAEGHHWLEELWDAYLPAELDGEAGSILTVLCFFSSREVAEAFREEAHAGDKTLEEMADALLTVLPDAVRGYAHLGRSISQAIEEQRDAEHTPARSDKVGRNEPCPCGSGKKYKRCCGSAVH